MLSVFQNSFFAPFFFSFLVFYVVDLPLAGSKANMLLIHTLITVVFIEESDWSLLWKARQQNRGQQYAGLLSGNLADLRLQFQPRLCLELTLSDFCLEKPLPLSSVKGAVDPPGGKQGLKLGPISDSWQFGRNQAISQSLTMWCKKNKQSVV